MPTCSNLAALGFLISYMRTHPSARRHLSPVCCCGILVFALHYGSSSATDDRLCCLLSGVWNLESTSTCPLLFSSSFFSWSSHSRLVILPVSYGREVERRKPIRSYIQTRNILYVRQHATTPAAVILWLRLPFS